mgnify:CR=1 FL=1
MLFAVLVLFSLGSSGYATHNRAGEILYQRVNDNPFLYRISIITYTKTDGQSAAADRFSEKMDLSVLTVVAERALARCCQGLTRGIMSIRPNMHIPVLELTE